MMDQNANVFSSNWPKDCSAWGMGSPHLKRGRESFTHTEARVTVTPSGFESRGLRCTPSAPLAAAGMCPGGTDLGKPRALRGGACSGGGVGPRGEMLRSSRTRRGSTCGPGEWGTEGLSRNTERSWRSWEGRVGVRFFRSGGGGVALGPGAGFTTTVHPSRLLTWDSLSPRLGSGRGRRSRLRRLWAARPYPVSVGLVGKTWTPPHPRARLGPPPSCILTSCSRVVLATGGFQEQREDRPPTIPSRGARPVAPRLRAPFPSLARLGCWRARAKRRGGVARPPGGRKFRRRGGRSALSVSALLAFLFPIVWSVLSRLPLLLDSGCNHNRPTP